jgi:hypothetical protein
LLGEGNVFSVVGRDGFMIEGKVGDINPLTGDTIIQPIGSLPKSESTAIEIEVWQIMIEWETEKRKKEFKSKNN